MWTRLFVGLCAALLALTAVQAADDPWVEPQNAAQAINDPDRYAWHLFVALNWPADLLNKKPDPNKAFGDAAPGPVTWETWRNARNQASDTAFPPNGTDPGEWLSKPTPLIKPISAFDDDALQQAARKEVLKNMNKPLPKFDLQPAEAEQNETRLNKEAFEFVRLNKFYNLDEQIKLLSTGQTTISFPLAAKEIKAQWRVIDALKDKPRYHWVEVTGTDGIKRVYGLTALHITTKDLPNWFWATFEHIDNKVSEGDGGKPGSEGWLRPSRDTLACPKAPYDCDLAPKGLGLEDTKWQHYRLRGTQIDFVDSRGNATMLANSQPEAGFQLSSSCISCHARSAVGATSRSAIFKCQFKTGQVVGDLGPPNPKWFVDSNGKLQFTQLDFVWSLMRAQGAMGKTFKAPLSDGPCPPGAQP